MARPKEQRGMSMYNFTGRELRPQRGSRKEAYVLAADLLLCWAVPEGKCNLAFGLFYAGYVLAGSREA